MKAPSIPFTEMVKSIPETLGIRVHEEPLYAVLRSEGHYEVRRYDRQVRATLTLTDVFFENFREEAFKRLADFIFSGNEKREKISMTSPVLMYRALTPGWTMSFILPRKFAGPRAVPRPNDPSIVIEEAPSYDVAVYSFHGNNTIEKINQHEEELGDWLTSQSNLIVPTGEVMVAQYDGPVTIPFLKRNEIQAVVYSLQS